VSTGTDLGRDPAIIEADVIRRREELAQTVDALSQTLHHKLDVRARALDKVRDLLGAATTDTGHPRPGPILLVGAAVAGGVALVRWRRHR
jgi:MYXO-CTERM domain-containing protein